MSKNFILWLIIAVIIVIGLLYFIYSGKTAITRLTPAFSPSISITISPTPKPAQSITPSTAVSPSRKPDATVTPYPFFNLPGEANCQLSGEIKFINYSTYDNQDALFKYSGVDHPGRLINWKIVPNDNLLIGPNLFAALAIPNGQSLIGVSLPENPVAKSYELTAAITYGRLVNGNVKIFTKACAGKTIVVLP